MHPSYTTPCSISTCINNLRRNGHFLIDCRPKGEIPMETKQWVHYMGGHVDYPNRTSGMLRITPTEIEFKASEYVAFQYHFKFPTIRLKSIRLETTKEISATRVWLAGPFLGALLKVETTYVVVGYEDELGLMQILLFDMPDDKDNKQKTELVHQFQKALAKTRH